ncbi:MAG: S24/S26 family peptidase [Bacteroidales bacterium]|nr:S24/S26 family peptidase [Bacteroidales bacterium]
MTEAREHISIVRETGFSLLSEGKTLKIRAEGYSMYPSVKPGSVIYIEAPGQDYMPLRGEIIAWKRQTGFVVHRVIRIIDRPDSKELVTRGDSCRYEDQPVEMGKLAGKVVRIETPSGTKVAEGRELITKPLYLYNRLLVWFILRFKKVKNLIGG